jgi:hypothetical protein
MTYHINITWGSGKVQTFAFQAKNKEAALLKATQSAVEWSKAFGWSLSSVKPYIVKGN